jgi:multidrug efflux pump subunit AcrB
MLSKNTSAWVFSSCCCAAGGAATPHAVGTPVFGGMIAASIFGIFLIPLLFITAERRRRWDKG